MPKTMEDLKTAFAGESQANRKYTAFAKKADEEGFHQVARLFRAAAHGETIHALRHFRNMGEIKSTQENLQAAIAGETYEFTEMYPAFIKDAQAEGNKPAEKGFADANSVEKIHAGLYKEALESLGKPGEEFDYYVCPICGYVHAKGAPERCPVCNTPGSKFEKIS
ncbi:MAG: rubrerythrin family protein [Anaerolineaceae bacterium]